MLSDAASENQKLLDSHQGLGAAADGAVEAKLLELTGQACEVQARYTPIFERLATEEPQLAVPLRRSNSALAAACGIRDQLSQRPTAANRNTAAAKLQTYLGESLAAIQSAQGAPARGTSFVAALINERDALRDPVIGFVCGLACLLFARRPRTQVVGAASGSNAVSSENGDLPVEPGGVAHSNTAIQLLDDAGSFFFCEVFDHTPVPLVLLDAEGKIIRLNVEAERISGKSTPELRRQYYWDALMPASVRDWVRSQFPLPEDAGPVEETWLGSDGSECTMLWSRRFFRSGGSSRAAVILLAGTREPAGSTGSRETIDAAQQLENELTMIGWHCDLLLEGPAPTIAARDLNHLQEGVDRAIQAVRRLLSSLAVQVASRSTGRDEPTDSSQ